jgi:Na+/proline symporter
VTTPLLALLAFLGLQLGIGIYISRRIHSESDYLVAGRRLSPLLATFSIFATWFGAETVIGSAAMVHGEGLSLASAEPFGYGLCLLLMGALLARPLWNRGLTTLADLYRMRFGGGVERLAAILLVPSSVLWAGAQIRAFGQVLATVSDLTPSTAIGIAALFVVAYTMFGGMLADAITDVIQGGVLSIGLGIMLVAVVQEAGGITASLQLVTTSGKIDLAPTAAGPWYATLEAWAIPVLGSVAATEVVSRVIASRSADVAQRASLTAGGLYLAIGSVPVLIALIGGSFVGPMSDPEQLLPTIARDLLPTVFFAIFAGGLISAILSTVDSTLLVASGLVSHNLLIPFFGISDERQKVRLARGGVVTFGLIAYALALNAEGVFALVQEASAFGSAGILVTVIGALFTTGGSPRTATATLLGGILGYMSARAAQIPIPFLTSLGVALACWTLGWLLDRVRR